MGNFLEYFLCVWYSIAMTTKQHLRMAAIVATLLDSKFGVGKFRFGFAAILDLMPEVGDVVAAVLSFYLVWIALEMDLPASLIAQMVGNILFNLFFGLIPVVGDIIYLVHKANIKNLAILESYAQKVVNAEIIS